MGILSGDCEADQIQLLVNQAAGFNVSGSEIENFKTYVDKSIADMQSFLIDVEENVPQEEKAFQRAVDERVRGGVIFERVVFILNAKLKLIMVLSILFDHSSVYLLSKSDEVS